jgi:parallel beta-helix repeat protein
VRFITGEGRMKNETAHKMILSFLLIGILSVIFNINPVQAYTATGTITIKSDGTWDPSDAPITKTGDLYTITQDIYTPYGITILLSNMILDGAGFTLHHTTTTKSSGIYVFHQTNVTIKRLSIDSFDKGIYLYYSSFNNVTGNRLTSNYGGLVLESTLANHNTITCNNFTSNFYGIYARDSTYNNIFHNNFVSNTFQAFDTSASPPQSSTNSWNDNYPSGGNYWNDHTDPDDLKGPNQNQIGSDGIVDQPKNIPDSGARDNYPLKNPYGIYSLTINVDAADGGTTNPPSGTYSYKTGSQVEVQANPDSGFSFARWELESAMAGENPTITVLVNRNLSLRAVFVPKIVIPAVPFGTLAVSLAMMLTLAGLTWFKRKPSG